jgi:hypothetical protein
MTPELQTTLSVGVPTVAVLIGILVNNSRLGDLNSRFGDFNVRLDELRSHFDQRIDHMQQTWRSELRRVEEVLDARLTNLEQRMAHLEQRLG